MPFLDVGTTKRKSMSRARRLRIWETGQGRCVVCGLPIDGVRENWIVEHIRPLALGGEDTDKNCGPAHEHCARTKTENDVSMIAKAKRQKAGHLGIKTRKGRPMPGTIASGVRRGMDGNTYDRKTGELIGGRRT